MDKEGKQLLRVSYNDRNGVLVEILVRPNPTSASKLLSVIWSGKAVDPLPYDNIAVLDVEAQLRVTEKNVAELEGTRFCSLWTFESHLQPKIDRLAYTREWKIQRTQNMADTKYLFGRLWLSNDVFGDVVYWTRHFGKDGLLDKPIAVLALESKEYVPISENHQKLVQRLLQLIIEHDAGIKSQESKKVKEKKTN
jgi:hypothetical protein